MRSHLPPGPNFGTQGARFQVEFIPVIVVDSAKAGEDVVGLDCAGERELSRKNEGNCCTRMQSDMNLNWLGGSEREAAVSGEPDTPCRIAINGRFHFRGRHASGGIAFSSAARIGLD
jgi:hypothetical protein